MKEYPAIIAALPREVKHLVRGWKMHKLEDQVVVYSNEHAVVAHAGMLPPQVAAAPPYGLPSDRGI